jgi:hypothetical protein
LSFIFTGQEAYEQKYQEDYEHRDQKSSHAKTMVRARKPMGVNGSERFQEQKQI